VGLDGNGAALHQIGDFRRQPDTLFHTACWCARGKTWPEVQSRQRTGNRIRSGVVVLRLSTHVVAIVALLVASSLALSGCGQSHPNVPDARDLCLSTSSSDFADLTYTLSGLPVADDDLSAALAPNPSTASGDFETGYSRVFYARDAILVDGTSIELPPGYPLWNTVRVYDTVQKAREAFDDMDPPRFVFSTPTGRAGEELDTPSVGDESGAWYYVRQVVDEDNGTSTTEIDAQVRLRTGNTISDIGVAIWYASLDETTAFLLDVARVSNEKIADNIYGP